MTKKTQHFFTLPEVVAVLVILGLLSAMALPMLKNPSDSARMEKTALDFEAFCGRVRLQAVENGKDRSVRFSPDNNEFYLSDPDDQEAEPSSIRWKLPEGFEYTGDEAENPEEDPEIFRFFPDGGASGKRILTMQYGNVRREFRVSLLTGLLASRELTGEEDE